MERGMRALTGALVLAVCLSGCTGDPDEVGEHASASTADPTAVPPDPYGLASKTTADLRAELRATEDGRAYAALSAAQRDKVKSIVTFLGRRLGYPPVEQRSAYDPTADKGDSMADIATAKPLDGGDR